MFYLFEKSCEFFNIYNIDSSIKFCLMEKNLNIILKHFQIALNITVYKFLFLYLFVIIYNANVYLFENLFAILS